MTIDTEKTKLIISMEGGIIQSIDMVADDGILTPVPSDFIEIRDYDVEAYNPYTLDIDKHGAKFKSLAW